jgi:hypothetical protein
MSDDGWKDPYRATPGKPPKKSKPKHHPSIEHEPHLASQEFEKDETELTAGMGLDPLGGPRSLDDEVEHSVWDEPARSVALSGETPASAVTYAEWLDKGEREVTRSKSALICLAVVLFAGPWAILGTFVSQLGGGTGAGGVIAICLVGPLIEEIMKAAGILWIVEKRPFYFRSRKQILLCAIASGLWFAVIENLIYLNVYIDSPSVWIILWRWTVCVLLHVGCTFISGVGLSRVWQKTMTLRTRPQMSLASKFIIAAVICHAVYNTAAVLFSAASNFS